MKTPAVFDQLTAQPAADLAAYESPNNGHAGLLTENERANIKALKAGLSLMGVTLQ